MSVGTSVTLLGGAAIGMTAGALLVPFTRRELAASVARSAGAASNAVVADKATTATATAVSATAVTSTVTTAAPIRVAPWHRVAMVVASGLVPAYVLHRVGWSIIALPPLLLLVGLIQLAYCDMTRRLLPKTLVYAVSAAVIVSGIVIAGVMHEWQRLVMASLGGAVFFAVLFVMNLINPSWIAFGDVRLSLVIGFGLAWVSPLALLEGFFLANLFAAVVGLSLIAAHRADRKSAVPFGLYLALATALVLLTWS
jgi:prepilin signal peptidase PulO-like enzyme (type II secretory pathway)